jgi:PKD repeat protein
MSIVAVHGPNTFGSQAVRQAGAVMGTVDPTNGLKWDFKLAASTPRSDQDFSWAFPTDGTPTPQLLADPAVVTYATPGSKTATLTVTNTARVVSNKALTNEVATITTTVAHGFKVGQSIVVAGVDATFNGTYIITSVPLTTTFTYAKLSTANVTSAASGGSATSDSAQYPAAGSYPITITAVTGTGGAGVSLLGADRSAGEEDYDPNDHTVAEVEDYANTLETAEQVQALIDAERAGKDRSTLITFLESMLPYDPSEHTIPDVVQYATDNPDETADIIAAEREGKNRTTLLSQLEALQTT